MEPMKNYYPFLFGNF